MKQIFFIFVFCLVPLYFVSAQNASVVSDIIEAEKISFSQAEYLCAVQSNIVAESVSLQEAHDKVQNDFYGKVKHDAIDSLDYSNAAFLIAKTWKIKKSLMYILAPSPRYAFKMLQADGVIDANKDPSQRLSGHDFLFMFSNCIEKYGE